MKRQIERKHNGERIPGVTMRAFTRNGRYYSLIDISVFKDGLVGIPHLVDIETLKEKLGKLVVTRAPAGTSISVYPLGVVKAEKLDSVNEEEFLKEILDEIESLNGRPTSEQKCYDAFQRFLQEQSEESRTNLREAYERAPGHNRIYILHDMDLKDVPIRMAIYGEQEIENWSHRAVARALGYKLPQIDISGRRKNRGTE
jgi:hypothetical protein